MENILFLSLPAGPLSLLIMHILYLGCGCIDLLGRCCCRCMGWMRMCLWVFALTLALTCYFSPVCVNTRDPQRPPAPPGTWQSALHMVGIQEILVDRKKFLIVLRSWIWIRIQTLSFTLFLLKHFPFKNLYFRYRRYYVGGWGCVNSRAGEGIVQREWICRNDCYSLDYLGKCKWQVKGLAKSQVPQIKH